MRVLYFIALHLTWASHLVRARKRTTNKTLCYLYLYMNNSILLTPYLTKHKMGDDASIISNRIIVGKCDMWHGSIRNQFRRVSPRVFTLRCNFYNGRPHMTTLCFLGSHCHVIRLLWENWLSPFLTTYPIYRIFIRNIFSLSIGNVKSSFTIETVFLSHH